MSDENRCPTAETLASLIDGRLSSAERLQVIGHIERCPRCREITAEAVVVGSALDAAAGERPWRRGLYAAAAAVAAIAILGTLLLWLGQVSPPSEPGWSARNAMERYLESAAGLADASLPQPDSGHGGVLALSDAVGPARAAFRTGVNLVDVEVALHRNDPAALRDAAGRLGRLVSSLEGVSGLAPRYGELQEGPGTRIPDAWVGLSEETRASLAGEQAVMAALGAWCRLARLSLEAGAPVDLDVEDVRALREALADRPLPQGVQRVLKEIEILGPRTPLAEEQRRRLGRLLDDLIEMM